MAYLAVSFDLGAMDADAAEAACFASGALAVTLSDARDDPVLEPKPGELRLWPATRVQALFDAALASPQLLAELAAQLGLTPRSLEVQSVADRVWEREWLRDFHAMRFGRRLWICPHHEQVHAPDAVIVQLDPGLAFGTGTHASTALCLEWLDATPIVGQTVCDYGTGSGVLALAAAKLGAARVYAYDIDPQALLATRDNASRNGLAHITLCESSAQLPERVDVLLANILASTLCELVDNFAMRLARGGRILLSGILSAQAQAVTCAYAPWFDMSPAGERADWVALAGIRR